jgi:hypothetical protein
MKKINFAWLIFFAFCLISSACQDSRQPDVSVNAPQNAAPKPKSSPGSEQADPAQTPENSGKPEDSAKNEKNSTKKDGGDEIENRCGWFENPTPANMSLIDKDGEWLIGAQGGYQAEGTDNIPDFGDDWVETNVHYGYGCACLRVIVDRKEKQIIKIISGTAKPIADCRQDKALGKP